MPLGLCNIHGQKRVGKTSLAQVALNILEQNYDIVHIFMDVGQIISSDPTLTINNLTNYLINKIKGKLEIPLGQDQMDGSLTSLSSCLGTLEKYKPDARIVIAIDEFDRLPTPLLTRNDMSDAFFLGLRSISTIRGVGLVLIGGERMNIVLNGPGVELNKFTAFPC